MRTSRERMAAYELDTVRDVYIEATAKYTRTSIMKNKHIAAAWIKRSGSYITSKKSKVICELKAVHNTLAEAADKYIRTLEMSEEEAAAAWCKRFA